MINRNFRDFKFQHKRNQNQILYTSEKIKDDTEIGKVLISKNYPFAIIKYKSDKFNFESTFKIKDAKILFKKF